MSRGGVAPFHSPRTEGERLPSSISAAEGRGREGRGEGVGRADFADQRFAPRTSAPCRPSRFALVCAGFIRSDCPQHWGCHGLYSLRLGWAGPGRLPCGRGEARADLRLATEAR